MPISEGSFSELEKVSVFQEPSGQRARKNWRDAPFSGHLGKESNEAKRGEREMVTGAAPRTSPFQSTMPPGGLVRMVMVCGGSVARRSGCGWAAGRGVAQDARRTQTARMAARRGMSGRGFVRSSLVGVWLCGC